MDSSELSASKLKVIGRFATSAEAEIVRTLLSEVGIRACVHSAELLTTMWYYGAVLGPVKLAVLDCDEERAVQAIKQFYTEAEDGRQIRAQDLPWAHEAEQLKNDSEDWEEVAESKPVDLELVRAYRAAVIGSYTCWPFLSIYSMWLMLDLGLWRIKNWRCPVAIAFNLLPPLAIAIQALDFSLHDPIRDAQDFAGMTFWSQSEGGFATAVFSAALLGPSLVALTKFTERSGEPTAPAP